MSSLTVIGPKSKILKGTMNILLNHLIELTIPLFKDISKVVICFQNGGTGVIFSKFAMVIL